jgi:hypothetical protein
VIVAHHGGEALIVTALTSGTTSVVLGLGVLARAKLWAVVRWLRHR